MGAHRLPRDSQPSRRGRIDWPGVRNDLTSGEGLFILLVLIVLSTGLLLSRQLGAFVLLGKWRGVQIVKVDDSFLFRLGLFCALLSIAWCVWRIYLIVKDNVRRPPNYDSNGRA